MRAQRKVIEDWRASLIAAARRDLETRARLAASGALFEGYHPEMEAVHLENAALLERAIEVLGGWPVRSKLAMTALAPRS